MAAETRLRLTITEVTRAFGDTHALRGVSLDAFAGEVLGVAGPNGAGKTTLMRIIAGEDTADSGTIRFGDALFSAEDATRLVSVVHQEVQLYPNLTVAENLVAGRGGRAAGRRPRPGAREHAMLRELGIEEYARAELGTCSLVVRQLTEIARVLLQEDAARIFLFDEPNSALTEAESQELFVRVRKLKEEGKIVVLVTHRLGELVEFADRVVVIRDGIAAALLEKAALSEAALARELVVGASIDVDPKADRIASEGRGWEASVEAWAHPERAFTGIDLRLHAGEIVGVVGVEGSGARELVRALGGLEQASGRVRFRDGSGPRGRIGFLPAERAHSLFPNYSVARNLAIRLGRGEIATRRGMLRIGRLNAIAEGLRRRFQVRCQSVGQLVTALSGGNQQKVAVAAALAAQPTLLVLEEPTRGVDVGAKSEIYRMLRDFVHEGGGVVALCTEVPELFELCDRVLAVDAGRIRADLEVGAFGSVTGLAERLATLTDAAL